MISFDKNMKVDLRSRQKIIYFWTKAGFRPISHGAEAPRGSPNIDPGGQCLAEARAPCLENE